MKESSAYAAFEINRNRSYNHWFEGQGHYLLCFCTSFYWSHFDSLKTWDYKCVLQLKTTTKIHSHTGIKSAPMARSLKTYNTRTSLKTLKGYQQFFLLINGFLIQFRWNNLKFTSFLHYCVNYTQKIKFKTHMMTRL